MFFFFGKVIAAALSVLYISDLDAALLIFFDVYTMGFTHGYDVLALQAIGFVLTEKSLFTYINSENTEGRLPL